MRSQLEITSFGQRHTAFMANHHMIQYAGADHVQSVLKGSGQGTIGLAGLWIAGGMIVNHDDGCGVMLQGDLYHFSRVHTSPIQRASGQFSKDSPIKSAQAI